ncbi:MAG: hypothetical protein ACLTW9_06840 [Enterocloster sp.]
MVLPNKPGMELAEGHVEALIRSGGGADLQGGALMGICSGQAAGTAGSARGGGAVLRGPGYRGPV